MIGLRLTIGLHFFSEGLDKVLHPKPFTAPFLAASKGPLAPTLQSYIWDADGLTRLGYKAGDRPRHPNVDFGATEEYWEQYAKQIIEHYGFDEQQQERAAEVVDKYKSRLESFADANGDDLLEYFRGIERRNEREADPRLQGVSSLRGQTQDWKAEIRGKGAPLIAQIDAYWSGLERDLNDLATAEQAKRGTLEIGKLGGGFDAETIDKIVPIFDLTIGVLLILGLFTRAAAVVGAVFLATIVASQWPGSVGAMATWPQLIEMFALFSLAGVHAGQYGGLDFLVRALRGKCCPPKREVVS